MLELAYKIRRTSVTSLAAALLLVVGVGADLQTSTFPALVWGSGDPDVPFASKSGLQALYEVRPAAQLVDDVSSSSDTPEQGTREEARVSAALSAVSVYVLGQLRRSELSQQPASSSLRAAVEASPAALYLPNIEGEAADLIEAVRATSAAVVTVGACGDGIAASHDLRSALAGGARPLAVVLCEDREEDVAEARRRLQAAEQPYRFVYVGRPDESGERPAARRLNAATGQTMVYCTGRCLAQSSRLRTHVYAAREYPLPVQTRLFECIILLIVLLVALYTGTMMLHILDTPSRFESDKKEASRHQD